MNRFFKAIVNTGQGFIKAVTRFSLTVVCLACATIVTCYLHKQFQNQKRFSRS